MDVSNDGELVATVFEHGRDIQLWHNLVYMKPWSQGLCKLTFCSEVKTELKRRIQVKKAEQHFNNG